MNFALDEVAMTRRIDALNPKTPGKIIAVHTNYPSRMNQRGKTPEFPSYFLKPSSSVAPTGSSLERPAGTELLAFEGEIALVIGETTRWVSPDEGWHHVTAITAANDFGVYDLRAADKGSNVRNKGRDGFTPIGPNYISTADISQEAWRVRTWVNGQLAQEDCSATLRFSFGQIVADLSQHMTLEPGDLILTGTPAGSSVVSPGDVVEVEVDAPEVEGSPSSGRLITTITQGLNEFGTFGAQPKVNTQQRIEAWGDERAFAEAVEAGKASSPDDVPPDAESVLTPEIRTLLGGVAVATVSSVLRSKGYGDIFIEGVRPIRPGGKILGTAKTLRFVPFRPDLFKKHGEGHNPQKSAVDSLREGQVLVIDARGVRETGTVGDILALRAQVKLAEGIVTDGGIRDAAALQELDIPIYSQGLHPSVLGRRHVPWEQDTTIACGGASVQPGDVIMGDDDGVIVIPSEILLDVANAAAELEKRDEWTAEQVKQGAPIQGLFPMNEEWRRKYEDSLR